MAQERVGELQEFDRCTTARAGPAHRYTAKGPTDVVGLVRLLSANDLLHMRKSPPVDGSPETAKRTLIKLAPVLGV